MRILLRGLAALAFAFFAWLLPCEVHAETCAGLYEVANNVLFAYSNYNVQAMTGSSSTLAKLRKEMVASSEALFAYSSAYFKGADDIDTDWDSLISECDDETRLAVYKGTVEIVVFLGKNGRATKSSLSGGSFFLKRWWSLLQKSHKDDADIFELEEALKHYYSASHLSMPETLLDVDSALKGSLSSP
jgi:hypothetical protein